MQLQRHDPEPMDEWWGPVGLVVLVIVEELWLLSLHYGQQKRRMVAAYCVGRKVGQHHKIFVDPVLACCLGLGLVEGHKSAEGVEWAGQLLYYFEVLHLLKLLYYDQLAEVSLGCHESVRESHWRGALTCRRSRAPNEHIEHVRSMNILQKLLAFCRKLVGSHCLPVHFLQFFLPNGRM